MGSKTLFNAVFDSPEQVVQFLLCNLRKFLCNKLKVIYCELFNLYDLLKEFKMLLQNHPQRYEKFLNFLYELETLSLVGNSSGSQSLDVGGDV